MARMAGQDIGEQLELAVQAACERYLAERICRVAKVPTPIAQLSRVEGGTFRAKHARAAHVDFYGVWLEKGPGFARGQALALECKATLEDRFPYSNVESQQREWLSDTLHAWVLVWFVRQSVVRLVPWQEFSPRSSVGVDDGMPAAAVDFLRPVLTAGYGTCSCEHRIGGHSDPGGCLDCDCMETWAGRGGFR